MHEIVRVEQRSARDCVICVVAMITGQTYETVFNLAGGLDDEGFSRTSAAKLFAKLGYTTAIYHGRTVPVGNVPHYCEVAFVVKPQIMHHLVVLLPHSRLVLDPSRNGRLRRVLQEYDAVNFIAPVIPIPGFTGFNP